uniref:Odorant receptor, family 61, subfamily C, member 3 n=1 Tax=Salmo trutta TaxID=8032 RepID=A0A674E577_SALTR
MDNISSIVMFTLSGSIHEPMYIFLCINGLYGSTSFYPAFLYTLTESNIISLSECVLQIFVIMTYSLCEFTNLTVMALDRYMAICRPLHYQTVMTRVAICKLLIFIWLFPCGTTGVPISIILACQEDIVKHIVNGSFFVWFNLLVAFLIFSYVKMIVACWHSQKNQHKFMSTCLPHLIALVLGKLMSVAIIVIPPFINPIIYGVKLTPIRTQIKKHFQQIQS